MKFEQFCILVVNVMGTSSTILDQKCSSFLGDLSEEELLGPLAALRDIGENNDQNYQAKFKLGYDEAKSLSSEFDEAWKRSDPEQLIILLESIPSEFPPLFEKFSSEDVDFWIAHVKSLPEINYFYPLHEYCMSLFNPQVLSNETIRLAISDDDLSLLIENENNIRPEDILFEDINTALMIESEKCFEWLARRAVFSDEQVLTMLEYVSSDHEYFSRIYKILSPTQNQFEEILEKVKEFQEEETLSFLLSQNRDSKNA